MSEDNNKVDLHKDNGNGNDQPGWGSESGAMQSDFGSYNGTGQTNFGGNNGTGTNWNDNNKGEWGKGFAIASLVLGIVSVVLFCTCCNVITALLSIIFAIIYLVKNSGGSKAMAITGIVTSVISVVLTGVLCIGIARSSYMNDIYTEIQSGDIKTEEDWERYFKNYLDENGYDYNVVPDDDGTF